jgi:hypothetical protein
VSESYVLVWNDGGAGGTGYVKEVRYGALNNEAITVPTVTQATLYDTWDDAMDKAIEIRAYVADLAPGVQLPMLFPMSVDKKALFKAKLKYGQ